MPPRRSSSSLVHAAWPSLYRTAILLTGDHGLAEDLVQTALARTYARWGRLREPAAARGYARRALVTQTTSLVPASLHPPRAAHRGAAGAGRARRHGQRRRRPRRRRRRARPACRPASARSSSCASTTTCRCRRPPTRSA
ncbi:sigma factor [Nocardioides convexus]|uniref:sigma factor n=1 Tax=Nocardioides convexus TaxID=2712224 RepID=UPI002418168C|nr:sigma factor [Nocardioides convexus]